MSKVRDISNLSNIIKTDASGNVSFVSGSTTLATINTSGQLSGSSPVLSSSYALNATSASYALSASNATNAITASFANAFTVANTLTAQTLVVQTITSSVDFVTGSTRFGSLSSNTHVITGSMFVTGALYVATGSVGIGTISPSNKLTVIGTDGADTTPATYGGTIKIVDYGVSGPQAVGGLEFRDSAGYGSKIFTNSTSDYLGFASRLGSATWTGSMVIKQATGNVGIGTESPNYKLHIHNPDSSDTRFQITNTTTGTTGGVGIQLITFGNDAVLTNRSNGYLVFETNSTERMRITSGSNVGIGYTSPTVALQVSGTIAVGNATTTGWGRFLYDTATNQVRIQASKDGTDSIGLSFYTQASGGGFAERMIISGSNVGIGTSSPPKLLTIYTADTTIMRFQSGAATTDHWDAEANQTARFYISNVSSGNGAYLVYNSASGWVGVSDARWKTNWTDLGPSLSLISQLKIGKYKMLDKDKQSIEGARWDYGIKAQELLDIIPDAVDVPKDENDKYGVLHNIVFYHAIKAIQELKAENDTLKEILQRNNIQ